MIDTHIHLDDSQYDADREEVISRFFDGGGETLINIGAGIGTSRCSVKIAKEHEKIFAVVGLHPHYFMKHETFGSEYRKEIKELAQNEKVVGIGEVGLDYFFQGENLGEEEYDNFKRRQKEGFLFQLDLARELKLPVVIHCRGDRSEAGSKFREKSEAYEDVWATIQNFPDLKYVFHGYGGRKEFTKKVLNYSNILFSFNGNITYAKPGAEILEVINLIPLKKIMLETDGPYLTPVPHRGERNEPIYVEYVAKKIAEIKNVDWGEVEKATTENARRLFNLY